MFLKSPDESIYRLALYSGLQRFEHKQHEKATYLNRPLNTVSFDGHSFSCFDLTDMKNSSLVSLMLIDSITGMFSFDTIDNTMKNYNINL